MLQNVSHSEIYSTKVKCRNNIENQLFFVKFYCRQLSSLRRVHKVRESSQNWAGNVRVSLSWIFQGFFFIFLVFTKIREVFKARAKNDNKFVALKRVLMENEKEGVS